MRTTNVLAALIGMTAAGVALAQPESRAIPAEDTAAAVVNPNWQAPRTSWGQPSLEGTWTTDDMRSVPRDRPEQFGNRERLTPEEFADRAGNDASRRDRAVNVEAFEVRNEWGTRTFGYTSQVIEPENGRTPPMTEAGRARAASRDRGTFGEGPFNSFDDFTLYDRCITRGILGGAFPVVYGNGLKIVQTPDTVAISYEMIHDTRLIHLDGRPQLDGRVREYLGDSHGHWEGDTLVIETQNLTDRTSIGPNGNGTRHSEQMKITERLTRVDPEMILYEARVEDPVTYTAPFTIRLMLTSQPNYRIYEYACHEGNQAVRNALAGQRAYDARVAEAIAKGEPPPERVFGGVAGGTLPKDESEFTNINAGTSDD